jgi:hypothetical protein
MPILHSGGNIGQFLLSPPDVANGFFFEIFTSETAAKPLVILALTSRAAINLRVGGPRTQALTTTNHWPVQNAVYILRLKVAKNFQLTGNCRFQRLPNFKN